MKTERKKWQTDESELPKYKKSMGWLIFVNLCCIANGIYLKLITFLKELLFYQAFLTYQLEFFFLLLVIQTKRPS
jgi:hypothetical protein